MIVGLWNHHYDDGPAAGAVDMPQRRAAIPTAIAMPHAAQSALTDGALLQRR